MRYTMFQSEEQGGKKGGELTRANGRLLRRVLAADDQGVTFSFMIEQLHMQVSTGTVVTHYDSDFGDDPDRQNDLTGPVKATVGRPITVRVDKSGKVVSVEGNEDPDPDPNQPENARPPRPIAGVIGTQEIRKLWRPLYAIDKKSLDSRIGDRWTIEDISSDGPLGTFGVELHHELKSVADGVAHIDITADVDFTPAIGHSPIHATLTGSDVKGAIDWDTSKGALKSWTTTQEMKMEMERAGEKQRRESMTQTAFTRMEPGSGKDAKDASKPAAGGAAPVPAAKPWRGKPRRRTVSQVLCSPGSRTSRTTNTTSGSEGPGEDEHEDGGMDSGGGFGSWLEHGGRRPARGVRPRGPRAGGGYRGSHPQVQDGPDDRVQRALRAHRRDDGRQHAQSREGRAEGRGQGAGQG